MTGKSGSILLPEAYRGREQAYVKHCLLEGYLKKLFLIVGMSAARLGIREMRYVDCFAGPWGDESEAIESTSIAVSLRVLSKCRQALENQGIRVQFRALYVERDPKAFARLKRYLNEREDDGIDAESLEGDFVELRPAILEWASRDSFAFFFVDPTAWRPVSVRVLEPLLQRPQSEFLINFMYDFVSRTASMHDFQPQIEELLGEEPDLGRLHGTEREKALLGIYRRNLKKSVPTEAQSPARSAYVRVLDPEKNRPKYHLVYLTSHPRGIIEFMEISEKLDLVQKRVRAATQQRKRIAKTGMGELFGSDEHVRDEQGHASLDEVERFWIGCLGEEPRRFGQAEFADMLEETDWFPGDFQRALGNLIASGRVCNLDAAKKRRTRFLHPEKRGERLQLIEGRK